MYGYETRPGPHPAKRTEYPQKISLKALEEIFQSCADLESRQILLGLENNIELSLCWLDGLVSGTAVSRDILLPLTDRLRQGEVQDLNACLDLMLKGSAYSYSVEQRQSLDQVVEDLCHGCCAVVFEPLGTALCFEVRSENLRSISQPDLEKSLKGAKDSFVETLRINTALVRRRLASPKLKLVESSLGRKSRTRVAILFIDGVADPKKVQELAERLDRVDVDALLATGTIEEHIVDAPLSPLPQLLHTERPDRFAIELAAGRIGLLIDGLPIGLLLPAGLGDFMQVTGDSSSNYLVASFLTALRYLSLGLAVLLPGLYVAVAMYHQEMIPTRLLLSIIEAKQNVPFSTGLEILGMLVAFELLQEAGLRLPDPIGDTVSIIGALIVGQSAVEAQVASPIAIIVVAVSGIASYTLPSQDLGSAIRLLRAALVISALMGGLFGIGVALCLAALHLAELDSFGMNYSAPLTDGRPFPLVRLLLRPPKAMDKFRDPRLGTPDKRRQR